MKSEYKEKWLVALRSGQYTQGRGRLRTKESTFCCLGVLVDSCKLGEWEEGIYKTKENRILTNLNIEELYLVGLQQDEQSKLIHLNDHCGYSFNQIAEWIEKNL